MKKIKSCENCIHFHNCNVDGIDARDYCSTNPDVVGYCNLWEGEKNHNYIL